MALNPVWILTPLGACQSAVTWARARPCNAAALAEAPEDWRKWLAEKSRGDGSSYGSSYGYGYGCGYGYGLSNGDGYGDGAGDDNGSGDSYCYGIGHGNGYGSGYGDSYDDGGGGGSSYGYGDSYDDEGYGLDTHRDIVSIEHAGERFTGDIRARMLMLIGELTGVNHDH